MPNQGGSKANGNPRFADLLRDIKPLRAEHTNLAENAAPKPIPAPKETRKNQHQVLQECLEVGHELEDIQPEDNLSFFRPGVQKNTFRKLKKGSYRIGAELDLHGMTLAKAQLEMAQFIQAAMKDNIRCVSIIHGKGFRSSNKEPRLKRMVNQWLQKNHGILAFCSARSVDGGTGAVYVLLKSLP